MKRSLFWKLAVFVLCLARFYAVVGSCLAVFPSVGEVAVYFVGG